MSVVSGDVDLSSIAKGLIEAVGGELNEKTLEGVRDVFRGIIRGANNKWETHIAERTTDLLMFDNIKCDCGAKIEVHRTRQDIVVSSPQ